MRAAPLLAVPVLLLACAAAACGRGGEERPAGGACAGAGFVGGAVRTDGVFAARIPERCADDRRRTCTIADGRGPIAGETVPAGIAQDCFAFNQFVGAGLSQIPGHAAGECFGRALLGVDGAGRAGVPAQQRPTFRCDGGRAPRANAGTRQGVAPPVRGSARVLRLAPDPWGRPPEAGQAGGGGRRPRAPAWGLLVWRTADGRRCYEPGQVVDRRTPGRSDAIPGVRPTGPGLRGTLLGSLRYDSRSGTGIQLYGLGRFTPYDPVAGGSCGRRLPLVSWERRWPRRDHGLAVTVVSGLVGRDVVAVHVTAGGRAHTARPRAGAFAVVLRGVHDRGVGVALLRRAGAVRRLR